MVFHKDKDVDLVIDSPNNFFLDKLLPENFDDNSDDEDNAEEDGEGEMVLIKNDIVIIIWVRGEGWSDGIRAAAFSTDSSKEDQRHSLYHQGQH